METSHLIIALFHILGVVPLFLYVGIQRAATQDAVYTTLLVLGCIVTAYHGYKAFIRFQAGSPYLWVNMIHFLYIGPLIAYIGYKQKDTPRSAYELLLLVGFGALGYHLYNLVQMLSNHRDS